jgi:uncharacterized protein
MFTRNTPVQNMNTKTALRSQENCADTVILWNRIAEALERIAPQPIVKHDLSTSSAWVWEGVSGTFRSVSRVNRVPIALLQGIDSQKATLLENTRRFGLGLPANNALLWGARGMGKSSLVKAVHAETGLTLLEIEREDIATLPALLRILEQQPHRFIVFCDDLSFDSGDTRYKALKAVLEGGIEGRPDNVIFYATSNRRHIVSREAIENEDDSALQARDVIDDKIALADRFGLWIGFHACSQEDYLAMVQAYSSAAKLKIADAQLRAQSLEWSITRGARSGRVAFQFIQDLAGQLGVALA